jgi:CRP/FNR family cyclic AMP-dependent transcriptional regulator
LAGNDCRRQRRLFERIWAGWIAGAGFVRVEVIAVTITPGPRGADRFRARVSTGTWQELLACGIERTYRPGETMLVQGAPAASALLIVTGRVEVSYLIETGEHCMIALRGSGDIVGEIASTSGGVRSATVTALEACLAYSVPSGTFLRVLERHGDRPELDRYIAAKHEEASQATVEAARIPARRRLALLLARFVELADHTAVDRLRIPMPQTRIADALGLSRSVVAQMVADLRTEGVLTTDRSIVVAEPDQLARRARGD